MRSLSLLFLLATATAAPAIAAGQASPASHDRASASPVQLAMLQRDRSNRSENRFDRRQSTQERRFDSRQSRQERRFDNNDPNQRQERAFDNRQDRQERQFDRHQNDQEQRFDDRQDRRDDRNHSANNSHNWNTGWRNDRRYDWRGYRNSNRNIFRRPAYYAPYRGYRYNRFNIGVVIGSGFFGSRYWINDPWQYRLPAVYGGQRWIRYYNDVLLIDTRSGYVLDVNYDFFW